MIIESDFKPVWWMSNPHAQTIYTSLISAPTAPVNKTEQLELPDGDFINLAWATANLPAEAPLVIILHGLAGDIDSPYVSRFMHAFNQQGWRAVLMHFRGAGAAMNRLPKAYHSGDTGDLDYFTQILQQREPHTKKAIVGISLGGNVLLKWLGERGDQSIIHTAVAISVPYELNKVADRVNLGFSKIYQSHLLNSFKQILARKLSHFRNPPEALKRAANCTCFWTFDAQVTAPLYGFSSVHSYYRQSSSRQYLRYIKIPTLLIHAVDDPFMTPDAIPTEGELSSSTTLELSKKGGHMGFIAAGAKGIPQFWLDHRVPEYLAKQFQGHGTSLTA